MLKLWCTSELAFWTDEKEEARAAAIAKPHFTVARAALKSYARQIRRSQRTQNLKGDTSGARAGNTGTHAVQSRSGSSSLSLQGIVHMRPCSSRSRLVDRLDVDQVAAAEARSRILDAAAVDREMIAGMHFHFPAFGHVKRDRQGYQFAPALWQTGL